MASNNVTINERIKFVVDDVGMDKLISLLSNSGTLILNCPWCGLTVLPQANSGFNENGLEEQKVLCVGCGKDVRVRTYGMYGFILDIE